MDGTTLLVTVLSMVGVRLPVLIALCVGLVWVVGAPRDATRTGALVGLLLLLLASLGGMAAGILPMWMVRSGDFSAVSSLSAILGVLHFALAMVEAIGVVLVVWALVRLLRTVRSRPPDRSRRAMPGVSARWDGPAIGPGPPAGVVAGPFRVPAAVNAAGHATMPGLIQLR